MIKAYVVGPHCQGHLQCFAASDGVRSLRLMTLHSSAKAQMAYIFQQSLRIEELTSLVKTVHGYVHSIPASRRQTGLSPSHNGVAQRFPQPSV